MASDYVCVLCEITNQEYKCKLNGWLGATFPAQKIGENILKCITLHQISNAFNVSLILNAVISPSPTVYQYPTITDIQVLLIAQELLLSPTYCSL